MTGLHAAVEPHEHGMLAAADGNFDAGHAGDAITGQGLARLVHSGVRVLLTTHSEWTLEVLANMVRLSELSEEQREGISGADVALDPHQVGAWLFKPDADGAGSVVEEMPLDTDAGTFPAGFGEITEALYNEWARISNRIEAAKVGQRD